MKVAILLSTYNGEKFLESQIDSIIKQTFKDWNLFIRDDGSRDSTKRIIEKYIAKYSNIRLLNDSKYHRGIKGSFIYLLKNTESEFYMFCDQDDVWLPTKIEDSFKLAISYDQLRPILIATDLSVVDSNLNMLHKSMWEAANMRNKTNHLDLLEVCDYLTGCTMLFNESAKKAILETDKNNHFKILHDQLASISVLREKGIISVVDKSTILYRQHGKNVVGGKIVKNKVLYRLFRISALLRKEYRRYKIANFYFNTSLLRFCKLRLQALS